MVSKKKKRKQTFLIIGIVLILIFMGIFAVRNAVVGVSNNLEYTNEFDIEDKIGGSGQTEAFLNLPNETSLVSFTVDYGSRVRTEYRDSRDGTANIKYEIFNFKTNSYETIHNKQWNLKNYDRERNYVRLDGERIYIDGIPETMDSVNTKWYDHASYRRYTRYLSCLDGMSISEAKNLWCEGGSSSCTDSRYTFKCVYPGESFNVHEDRDDSNEDWGYEYFPKLITVGTDYIKDNQLKFRMSISLSTGMERWYEDYFKIDLFNVETPTIDTYSFNGTSCIYQSKYTYQTNANDYFTRNECEFQNNITECYLDEQCSTDKENYIVECKDNICVEEKDTWWNDLFPDKEEPTEPGETNKNITGLLLGIFISIVVLILLIIIIRNLIKRKK
jgi:hypothetical protein